MIIIESVVCGAVAHTEHTLDDIYSMLIYIIGAAKLLENTNSVFSHYWISIFKHDRVQRESAMM